MHQHILKSRKKIYFSTNLRIKVYADDTLLEVSRTPINRVESNQTINKLYNVLEMICYDTLLFPYLFG